MQGERVGKTSKERKEGNVGLEVKGQIASLITKT